MSMCEKDGEWMRLCLEEAEAARASGEIPIGAVIVKDGEVIARAHNLCEEAHDATAHAELLAISAACRRVGSWRLSNCTLYVSLEPCPMCAGAAVNARIGRVVYGAKNPRMGACESLIRLSSYPLESTPECRGGVLEEECLSVLHDFFSQKRNA